MILWFFFFCLGLLILIFWEFVFILNFFKMNRVSKNFDGLVVFNKFVIVVFYFIFLKESLLCLFIRF